MLRSALNRLEREQSSAARSAADDLHFNLHLLHICVHYSPQHTVETSGTKNWRVLVTPQEHSMLKIEGEIPYASLLSHRARALAELGKNISIDGFRKGHIPEKVLLARIGEMALLTEMAERALALAYPEIIRENKIDALGHPQISITKIAKDNPLGFSALVAIVPEITLPDYKKIARAAKKESATVSDEDVTEAAKDIERQKRAYERMQQKAAAKKQQDQSGLSLPTSETVDPQESKEKDSPMPELTDEYVKTLGAFTSVDDFKTKLREHLTIQKIQEVAATHRAAITDDIIGMSVIDVPRILIDAEIGQMFGQMEQDLARANLRIDDYLGHIKKTKEALASEWSPAAEKRAKLQLILNEIAKKESITAASDAVDREVAHLLEQYKDADKERVRLYVTSMLTNDEVLKMLENESVV
jgi:trigger factor